MSHEAFSQAILGEPDEEAHRLVYADWLAERGDPRGEFVHVQCLLHRWREGTGDWIAVAPQLARLRLRERELLTAHAEEWSQPFRPPAREVEFRRGFVEGIRISGNDLVAHGARLFSLAPIQRLRTSEVHGTLATTLAASAFLRGVVSLEAHSGWSNSLRTLLESPHLAGLRRLAIRIVWWGRQWLDNLVEWPGLARLHCLDLVGHRMMPLDAVLRLLQSPHFSPACTLRYHQDWPPGVRILDLGPSLAVVREPEMLRKLLLLAGGSPEPFTHRPLRELAREAFATPATVRTLAQALNAPNQQRRAAAVLLLGRLGAAALPALPDLLRRLYEPDASLRAHAANALASLLPHLPEPLPAALCLLANPVQSAEANLRRAVEDLPVPDEAWLSFARLCARRLAWRAAFGTPQGLSPDWLARRTTPLTTRNLLRLQRLIEDVLMLATEQGEGSEREAAWLLSRQCELLVRARIGHR